MAFRLNKLVKIYDKSHDNAAEASGLLSKKYEIRKVQGGNIKFLVQTFEETGSVMDVPRSGRPFTATTEVIEDQICESLARSPQS